MPTLLYIDTSGNTATIALSANGGLKALRRHHQAQEQAAVINLLIEDLLQECDLQLRDLDALCVCAGPGSYTGLRVGLSTAKGIAFALDKPLMLFNKLELIAREFNTQHTASQLVVALKARLGEYFVARYDAAHTVLTEPQHLFEAGLDTMLQGQEALLLSDTDLPYTGPRVMIPADYAAGMDSWIAFATARFATGRFDDLAYSEPFYLKAAFTTQSKK